MSSIYDLRRFKPSKREKALARRDAREYLRLWRRRALYVTVTFFLSCAPVVPFLDGRSLHPYWESFGRYLLLLSMALLIPFVICVGVMISSWSFLRNLKKGRL